MSVRSSLEETDVIRQDGVLYDRLNHTKEFDNPLSFDIVWLRSYEDLPSVFQRYITLRASGRSAAQLVSNPQLVQLLAHKNNRLELHALNMNVTKVTIHSLVHHLILPTILSTL